MTAISISQVQLLGHFIGIDIHSVNRKNLDIRYSSQVIFTPFEMDVRKMISSKVKRGSVSVKITQHSSGHLKSFLPSKETVKETLNALTDIMSVCDANNVVKEIPFDTVLEYATTIDSHLDAHQSMELKKEFLRAFEATLDKFIEMKVREGSFLQNQIKNNFEVLKKLTHKANLLSKGASSTHRERLLKNIKEIQKDIDIDEERLLKEITLYAEKVDISEEITRCCSHIAQAERLLDAENYYVGREIEFIVQELHRESNTIASKVFDLDLKKITIEFRCELEKIREQVANIE